MNHFMKQPFWIIQGFRKFYHTRHPKNAKQTHLSTVFISSFIHSIFMSKLIIIYLSAHIFKCEYFVISRIG